MKLVVVINLSDNLEKTHLVYQSLRDTAIIRNIDISIEVVGLESEDNILTAQSIDDAAAVIIVTETDFPKERFMNKRIIELSTQEAENNIDGIFDSIIAEEKSMDNSSNNEVLNNVNNVKEVDIKVDNQSKVIYSYLKSGVTAIIPLIITGGLLTVLAYFFSIDTKNATGFSGTIVSIATCVLAFIVPILSGFIAFSIADRAGFLTGLIGGAFASVLGLGFLGGIIVGLISGYLAKYLLKYIRLPQSWDAFKTVVLVPLLSIFIIGLFMVYVADPIAKVFYDVIGSWIKDLSMSNLIIMGAIIGLFVAFDIGGIFSKATLVSAFALVGSGVFIPQAAAIAAAMVPPLGLALATVIAKNKFSSEEKEAGKAAWILGISALTEGAIPFAVVDPIRVIPSAMIGSAITGALVAAFGSCVKVANGGIFALTVNGAVTGLLGIVISIIVGVIITAYLVKYLKK